MIADQHPLRLYNPRGQSDEAIMGNFVARRETLDLALNLLRHTAEGGANEHHIIIGARGMGKTTLLRRLALAIRDDRALSARLIPLQFREEQYNVISLDTFWRNCGEALAEWCDRNGRPEAASCLDREITLPEWRDANSAADRFLQLCRDQGGRPCLLVDNLDMILDGVKDQGWLLRQVLQRRDGPVVIGTATELLRQGGDPEAPFYEFFHPIEITPLSVEELKSCLLALAEGRGEAGQRVADIVQESPERIRTLYELTGGNPRILVLLYHVLARTEGDEVLADLEALLDEVTPFYKARIEELQSALQRAIVDAIALNWDPLLSGRLAEVTGIEVTTVSGQLSRLRKAGIIEEVALSGARAGYRLSERFMNIWYLMRHGTRRSQQRLRWLTMFLKKWFSVAELENLVTFYAGERGKAGWPGYDEAVAEALEEARREENVGGGVFGQGPMPDLLRQVEEKFKAKDMEGVLSLLGGDDALPTGIKEAPPLWQLLALMWKATALSVSKGHEQGIPYYDALLEQFGTEEGESIEKLLGGVLVLKGMALENLESFDGALSVYDQALKRTRTSGTETEVMARLGQGRALFGLARYEDSAAAYEELEKRIFSEPGDFFKQRLSEVLRGKGRAFLLAGRFPEMIASCEEILRSSSGDMVSARLTDVMWALGIKSEFLSYLSNSYAEAEKCARHTLVLEPDGPTWSALAWALIAQGKDERAFKVIEEREGQIPETFRSLLRAGVELIRNNLGNAITQLSRALSDEDFMDFMGLTRFLRIAVERGFGEQLIGWFEESGMSDRYMPIYAALVSAERGEKFLRDLSPEAEGVAREFYALLALGTDKALLSRGRKRGRVKKGGAA